MSPSTYTSPERWGERFAWRSAGLRFFAYRFYLRQRFGHPVQRVSVDAGLSCPNATGTSAGCVFCDNRSFSPSRRLRTEGLIEPGIAQQLDAGIARLQRRYPGCAHFVAYFQPSTNTFGPICRLREVYEQAVNHANVVAVAIGTRPDCVGDDALDLLTEIAARTHLSVEFGMQTMHDRTLEWMHRGHGHAATVDAIERSRGRGFEIGTHVIVGLPGESGEDNLATARELARLNVHAVKLHNLYAVEGTPLAEWTRTGRVELIDRATYVRRVVDMLEVLPPHTVIQRLGGDAPREFLVGPAWCLDKTAVRQAIDAEFDRRGTWQGRGFSRAEAVG
ncbi:MAG: TIGR01212 family radical SAM protein [Planctomycetes bacterium]|nr:TIGR01212 family radical SAM protein [Planctomycetota bacterium]